MRFSDIYNNNLKESLEDWNSNNIWIHYSEEEMLRFNIKSIWQDPLAIYCFPQTFKPSTPMWAKMKYKFEISIKENARILDISKITKTQIHQLLEKCGKDAIEYYEHSIERYPPTSMKDNARKMWDAMREVFVTSYVGNAGKAKWNRLIRECGWDAIFDDTNTIYHGEVQLVILNPSIIKNIKSFPNKLNAFASVKKVTEDVKNLLSKYNGDIVVTGPKKIKENSWGNNITKIASQIELHKSETNYVYIKIEWVPDTNFSDRINISVRYSRPSLGYGSGAEYSIVKNQYDNYSSLTRLESDLDKIFNQITETTTSTQTMSLWHGGNLSDNLSLISRHPGRIEYGNGLYTTTHYHTATKYSKGSRKLYKIILEKGNDANDSFINYDNAIDFITKNISVNRKFELISILEKYHKNGSIPAYIFNNIVLDFIPASRTKKLSQFLVDNGVDYITIPNAFGWKEMMIVIFNMKKIIDIKRINPKDKIEVFDLPTNFN